MENDLENTIDPRLDQISDCLYRVTSKAIIIKDKKILLVKELAGFYGLPGGGIDHGQTPQESLIREIEEEITVSVSLEQIEQEPIYAIISKKPAIHIPRMLLYYLVSVDDSFNPQAKELSFIWVNKDEFAKITLGPTIELARNKLAELL